MLFFNLLSLFVIIIFTRNKNVLKLSKLSYKNVNRQSNSNSGFDHRYNLTTDLNLEQLKKIRFYFQKKKILEILEDNSIDINTKLNIIKNNDIIKYFDNNVTNNIGKNDFYLDFDI